MVPVAVNRSSVPVSWGDLLGSAPVESLRGMALDTGLLSGTDVSGEEEIPALCAAAHVAGAAIGRILIRQEAVVLVVTEAR